MFIIILKRMILLFISISIMNTTQWDKGHIINLLREYLTPRASLKTIALKEFSQKSDLLKVHYTNPEVKQTRHV